MRHGSSSQAAKTLSSASAGIAPSNLGAFGVLGSKSANRNAKYGDGKTGIDSA
jgi:hypothetical protein